MVDPAESRAADETIAPLGSCELGRAGTADWRKSVSKWGVIWGYSGVFRPNPAISGRIPDHLRAHFGLETAMIPKDFRPAVHLTRFARTKSI
jgi:hypothetical protein